MTYGSIGAPRIQNEKYTNVPGNLSGNVNNIILITISERFRTHFSNCFSEASLHIMHVEISSNEIEIHGQRSFHSSTMTVSLVCEPIEKNERGK